jgi:hypothetical protein
MNDAATDMLILIVFAFTVGVLWFIAAMLNKKDREGNALIAICFFLIAILASQ